MLKNKKQYEHGVISMGITVTLDYTLHNLKNGQEITAEIHKEARLKIDPQFMQFESSHTDIFSKLLEFQKGANQLLQETKKLLSKGQYLTFSIMTSGYEDVAEYTQYVPTGPLQTTLNPLFFNMWSYKGNGMAECDGADLSEDEGGLHLCPDTQYTNENHDIWMPWGQDIFKTLETAGI